MAQTFSQWLEHKAHTEPEVYGELFGWLGKAMKGVGKGVNWATTKALRGGTWAGSFKSPGWGGAAAHWATQQDPASQLGRGPSGYSDQGYNRYHNYFRRAIPAILPPTPTPAAAPAAPPAAAPTP